MLFSEEEELSQPSKSFGFFKKLRTSLLVTAYWKPSGIIKELIPITFPFSSESGPPETE